MVENQPSPNFLIFMTSCYAYQTKRNFELWRKSDYENLLKNPTIAEMLSAK